MTCLVRLLLLLGLASILVVIALPNGRRLEMLQWSIRGCFVVVISLLGLSCFLGSLLLLLRAR